MLDLGRLRQGPKILEVDPGKDLYAIYLRNMATLKILPPGYRWAKLRRRMQDAVNIE
jgi:hypothetical protein